LAAPEIMKEGNRASIDDGPMGYALLKLKIL